ncbi:MAG: thiamine pyrophosphate-dependent enzyme, partial [Cyanobacteriota bacterium]
AIGMDHNRATSHPEIWRKAHAFGMFGEEVDGMDVISVHDAANRAVQRARNGEGPTLLECLTYRFRGHSLADPDELRSQTEKQFWSDRDPIQQFKSKLLGMSVVTESDLIAIEKDVDLEISEAVDFALQAPEPESDDLTNYVWA